tara:strand:- start:6513 stop:6800 length:288 start_codon:yes stop_codon:yes gene_type:complete
MEPKSEYLDLEWMDRTSEFERDQQAVMLACSRRTLMWVTENQLKFHSGLQGQALFDATEPLVELGIIHQFEDADGVYFTLNERLEKWVSSQSGLK